MTDSMASLRSQLLLWITPRLKPEAMEWVCHQQEKISSGNQQALFLSFGLTPRKTGKSDLLLTPQELAWANEYRPGWNPHNWTIDQLVRTLFIVSYPNSDPTAFLTVMNQLFATGEVHELIALYQALILFPHPELFAARAEEGIRTNMKAVFQAVATNNPYPAQYLGEMAWNQMVVKCVFVGVPLYQVIGLDGRSNPALTQMLCDYARERWAAQRVVTPELWRPVGFSLTEQGIECLKRVQAAASAIDQQAAHLAFISSDHPRRDEFLRTEPIHADSTSSASPQPHNWDELGIQWNQS